MATSRKYANLPDLDSAQDIYETPDLTDGVSTLQTSNSPTSPSRRLSTSSAESNHFTDGISRASLRPSQARSHFLPARVDARDVDFSDRVSSKRKSYTTSSRRRRKGARADALGDLSDEEDDDDESLERRIARLKREIEEVKEEVGRRSDERKRYPAASSDRPDDSVNERSVDALGEVVEGLHTGVSGSDQSASDALIKSLSSTISTTQKVSSALLSTTNSDQSSLSVSYTPAFTSAHALSKAAAFDTRLTLLEKLLGFSNVSAQPPTPVLPALTSLSSQVTTLTSTSASSLEAQGRRVRQLTSEAEKLVETRRTAQTALEDARNRKRDLDIELLGRHQVSSSDTAAAIASIDTPGEQIEQELRSRINALFAALTTVERLEPMLSPLLERLRSLRKIHGQAAAVAENLDVVEKRQVDMDQEIEKWAAGLEKVEAAVKESEGVLKGNTEVVEGWVKGLEERMKKAGV